jgi:hypothetical protein
MLEAAKEHWGGLGFEVRFDSTIPNGAETCHFTFWKAAPGEQTRWMEYTRELERKALEHARTADE